MSYLSLNFGKLCTNRPLTCSLSTIIYIFREACTCFTWWTSTQPAVCLCYGVYSSRLSPSHGSLVPRSSTSALNIWLVTRYIHQSWIFKSFCDATATAAVTATTYATATDSDTDKTWIFKSFSRNALRKTLEDHWHCQMTAAIELVGVSMCFLD